MTSSCRYLPESGALSGASFERQTAEFLDALEQKAEDLSVRIGQTAAAISDAVSVGNEAGTTARQAAGIATTAQQLAGQALEALAGVREEANAASLAAGRAESTVETIRATLEATHIRLEAALSLAEEADAGARVAGDVASVARSTAADAASGAAVALDRADTAAEIADRARATGEAALVQVREALAAAVWLPLYFEANQSEPVRSVIPPDRRTASLVALDPNGPPVAGLSLSAALTFGDDRITIPAAPATVDVTAFRGRSVDFSMSGLGPNATGVGVLLRLGV